MLGYLWNILVMKLPLALVGEIIRNSLLSFIFPFSRYIEFLGLYSPDTLDSYQFSFHVTAESKVFIFEGWLSVAVA